MRNHAPNCVGATLATLLVLLFAAAPMNAALAQMPSGIAPMPNLNLPEADVDETEQSTVQKRDILKAYRKGVEDIAEGNCRSAADKFEFILGFIDDHPTVYYAAATAARCMRSFRSATGYYESAIEFDPELWEAHRFLGVSYLALGDIDAANDTLAELDLARVDCGSECPSELEAAYAALRKSVETAHSHSAKR